MADCPFILNTLYKMKKEGLVNVDIQFQVAGFRTHLMDIIEHKQNGTFNGTSCFVEYDGNLSKNFYYWKLQTLYGYALFQMNY